MCLAGGGLTMPIPGQMEKCKGAMLGTAIGDALGWPNEPRAKNRKKHIEVSDCFVEWTRSSNNPRWHDEKILPGEYSDDTQLTLSVARSIITGDWERFFAEKELPFWLRYERGGGSALLKAAKTLKRGSLPWQSDYARDYFNAGGNGAAMRILPHVIAAAEKPDIQKLMLDVAKNTRITHGHPRAFLGAACYAYALDYLLKKDSVLEYGELVGAILDGQTAWGAVPDSGVFGDWIYTAQRFCNYDFSTEWASSLERMAARLKYIQGSLKKGLILDDKKVLTELECFAKANGAGDVATLAAIYLSSRYANNPSLGIKIPAFSFGADTDTIASMTGGLLGMLSGTSWIPVEWQIVQDHDCLLRMTELLLASNKKEAAEENSAKAGIQKNLWTTTPIGKMTLINSKHVPNGKNGDVIIEKWQTMLGQVLYTKTFQRSAPSLPDHQFDRPAKSDQQTIQEVVPIQMCIQENLTTLQQTTGGKSQDITTQKRQQRFSLTPAAIAELLDRPKFAMNFSLRKALIIADCLMEGKLNQAEIAKQFKVQESVVEQLSNYITSE